MAFRTNLMPTLQEKSASGSVATFNTALAMPLSSCNIAVNAWQEGSGDPSPSNVRPIHGFSEVNATRAGKNLISDYKELVGRYLKDDGEPSGSSVSWDTSPFYPITGNKNYYLSCENPPLSSQAPRICFYDINKRLISYVNAMVNRTISTPSNAVFIRLSLFHAAYNYQLEVGNTKTSYEPYTGNIYTIQLGETVYGGSYNSVSGKKMLTYRKVILDGTQKIALLNWRATATSTAWCYVPSVTPDFDYNSIPICSILKSVSYGAIYSGAIDYQCAFYNRDTPYGLFIRYGDISLSTKEAINKFLSNNPIEIIYPVISPIKTDIGSTPISTNIGNNTIFADIGDIDLTYKDLDIAKRGNFREVFKLPS